MMMSLENERIIDAYKYATYDYLRIFINEHSRKQIGNSNKPMHDAILYSISSGGKAIRPALLLEFCRICGGSWRQAVPAAAALELIHCFSLVHDDMPCLDNDDMRRGKPSCHKACGEAAALLAGDAMENFAYEMLACATSLAPKNTLQLVKILSVATSKMLAGQEIDVFLPQMKLNPLNKEVLDTMVAGKTAALIIAACKMGVVAANGSAHLLEIAERYGKKLGIAFQIKDDILDVVGEESIIGKPIGSDKINRKSTFVSVYGLEQASIMADKLTEEALFDLETFEQRQFLLELTRKLLMRRV